MGGNLTIAASTATNIFGGGGGGGAGIISQDNFRTRTRNANNTVTGSVFSSNWIPAGYQSVGGNTSTSAVLLDRTQMASLMPSLLSDPNCPADQTRFLHCFQDGNEAEGLINVDIPSAGNYREVYISWWEARPSGARAAGEKFMRIDTHQQDDNIGHDNVIGRGNIEAVNFNQMMLFENGPNVEPDYGQVGNVAVPWNGTLAHWETRLLLSTSTNSNGVWTLWKDGVQLTSASGIKFSNTATQAGWNLRRFTLGGWNSGSHGWEDWPIQRVFVAWRLATQRQGVWAIT